MTTLSNTLREHLTRAGSVNAIARAAGVSQPSLSRFLRGGDLKLVTVDRLTEYLGLSIQPTKGGEA